MQPVTLPPQDGETRGKRIAIGLGGYPEVTLAEARETALANRRKVRNGEDPRKRNPVAMRQASKSVPDFKTAAEAVIDFKAASWSNPKSAGQWRASLATYAYPVLGKLGADAVTTADVLAVLEPIWTAKRETAGRVRQRIGAVMRWAKAKGHRADDPAGDEMLLALGAKRAAPKHHRAIHYSLAGDAVRKVRESNAWSATKLLSSSWC